MSETTITLFCPTCGDGFTVTEAKLSGKGLLQCWVCTRLRNSVEPENDATWKLEMREAGYAV